MKRTTNEKMTKMETSISVMPVSGQATKLSKDMEEFECKESLNLEFIIILLLLGSP